VRSGDVWRPHIQILFLQAHVYPVEENNTGNTDHQGGNGE